MKITKVLTILYLLVLLIGCKESSTIMSAIKDGDEIEEGSNVAFTLDQNYPNPFNPSTSINFSVSKQMILKMSVYTEDWYLVKVIYDQEANPGTYRIDFNAENNQGKQLPSGNYYYTLEGEGLTLTRVMKLAK